MSDNSEVKTRKFKAIKTGFYDNTQRIPGGRHEVFDAPVDFKASWAVPVEEEVEQIEKEPEPEITALSEPKPKSEGPATAVEQYKRSQLDEADVETL